MKNKLLITIVIIFSLAVGLVIGMGCGSSISPEATAETLKLPEAVTQLKYEIKIVAEAKTSSHEDVKVINIGDCEFVMVTRTFESGAIDIEPYKPCSK